MNFGRKSNIDYIHTIITNIYIYICKIQSNIFSLKIESQRKTDIYALVLASVPGFKVVREKARKELFPAAAPCAWPGRKLEHCGEPLEIKTGKPVLHKYSISRL